jgi:hypothetical protein
MDLSRRSFVRGLIAAPAIVAASSIMPVKLIDWSAPVQVIGDSWQEALHVALQNRADSYADLVSNSNAILDAMKRKGLWYESESIFPLRDVG